MAPRDDTAGSRYEPFVEPGECYKIHTFLGIYVGRVIGINPAMTHAKLDTCSWVAHEGRMGQAMAEGQESFKDVEFLGDGIMVPLSGVIMPWRHALPTVTK